MPPRSPPGEKQKQVPVAFPAALRDRLDAAALNAGHSFAEEVRQRILRTIIEDAVADAKTRELARDVIGLVTDIHALAGSVWHRHPDVHQAVVEAVKTWLEGIAPPEMKSRAAHDLLGFLTADDPLTIGRTIARQRLAKRARPNTKENGQ
jgi:hypothetical protein